MEILLGILVLILVVDTVRVARRVLAPNDPHGVHPTTKERFARWKHMGIKRGG